MLANSEEIAFLGGGNRERVLADRAFNAILAGKQSILEKRAYMSFLDTTAVKHFGFLLSCVQRCPGIALALLHDTAPALPCNPLVPP